MRVLLVAVVLASCARSREPELPQPDATSRARTYVKCDPGPTLERMRKNASTFGCKVAERSNGTMISCGDVDMWIVPDATGMEVTCTGLPVNCNQRGDQLMRDSSPKE